jgi:two-component system response regulator HydG
VGLLAEYFLDASDIADRGQVRHLSPEAMEILAGHDWPGNVRELRNVIERALILEPSDEITPSSLILDRRAPVAAARADRPGDPEREPGDFSLQTAEREFILRALKETGWQRTRAAALLGITRATLHAKLKRYDIQPPDTPAKPAPVRSPSQDGGELQKTKR